MFSANFSWSMSSCIFNTGSTDVTNNLRALLSKICRFEIPFLIMHLFRTFRGGGHDRMTPTFYFLWEHANGLEENHRVVAEEHANVLKKYVNLLLLRVGHVTRPYMGNSAYYPSWRDITPLIFQSEVHAAPRRRVLYVSKRVSLGK